MLRRWLLVVILVVVATALAGGIAAADPAPSHWATPSATIAAPTASPGTALAPAAQHTVWPKSGEAAYTLGTGPVRASPHQPVVAIASVAKVMTAYLVLRASPLNSTRRGFTLVVTRRDVQDTARRAGRDESIVPVRRGEVLTERQALAALLLPSANNIAIMLARRVAGTVTQFLRQMNAAAVRLGMRHTRYTDPSGFEATTTSTAADQTRLALAAMRIGFLAGIVGRSSYRIPVAGVVHNYDVLLGHDGFVGIKTGSDDAAGGCFVFRSRRLIGHQVVLITGAVLGQRGRNIIAAALDASRALVDRVAPHHAS